MTVTGIPNDSSPQINRIRNFWPREMAVSSHGCLFILFQKLVLH